VFEVLACAIKQGKERKHIVWHQWLTPVILATWETEIRRITVPGQHCK
jgi:hypothetical protein